MEAICRGLARPGRHPPESDTPHGPRPDGCSGEPSAGMTVSIPAARAPEGGAPADGTWTAAPGECDLYSTPTQAQRTASTLRSSVSPSERLRLDRPHTIELARGKMSSHACSPKQAEPVTQQNSWRNPRTSPPHRRGASPAACGGLG